MSFSPGDIVSKCWKIGGRGRLTAFGLPGAFDATVVLYPACIKGSASGDVLRCIEGLGAGVLRKTAAVA